MPRTTLGREAVAALDRLHAARDAGDELNASLAEHDLNLALDAIAASIAAKRPARARQSSRDGQRAAGRARSSGRR